MLSYVFTCWRQHEFIETIQAKWKISWKCRCDRVNLQNSSECHTNWKWIHRHGTNSQLLGNPSAETIVKIYRLQIYSMYEIKGTVTIALLCCALPCVCLAFASLWMRKSQCNWWQLFGRIFRFHWLQFFKTILTLNDPRPIRSIADAFGTRWKLSHMKCHPNKSKSNNANKSSNFYGFI